jgi:hypothetical protein
MFQPIMAQSTGHNPFRTENSSNNMMMAIPQQSTSSILPTQQSTANPFRSNTMPQMSTSTPTLPYFNNNNNFSALGNNMMQQPPLQTTAMVNSNNPFALTNTTSPPSTIMVASPTPNIASNNPFNNATPKHQQQLQPWGSSIF